MSRIPEAVIDQVQNATDIVGVVQSYIPLKRAGVNFKAPCPFHSEKTPSFVVSPVKQIYHCFGCGAGGNVFHFIMNMEKSSFVDVVRDLAQKAGISIPEMTETLAPSFQKRYFELNQFAADFFARLLRKYPKGVEYLKARGLKEEALKFFQLGFVPKEWGLLIDAAKKKGFDIKELDRAGLAVQGRSGWHDRFIDRVMFPILDIKGRVLAFGGRTVGEANPKYLNSPETEFFKKRNTLYGLNWGKKSILQQKRVLVLEGYMDLIGLHQAGFSNCVATLGTALTIEHVGILTRFADEIIISYDGDAAGVAAALRGIDLFVATGAQVRVLILPDQLDPDDFVRQKGKEAFQALIDSAPYYLDYKLDHLCKQFDPATPYGQRDIGRAMLISISKLEDLLLKNAWIKKCAERLRINEKVLLEQTVKDSASVPSLSFPPRLTEKIEEPDLLSIEAEILRFIFEKPVFASQACSELECSDFEDPDFRGIFEKIRDLSIDGLWSGLPSLMSQIKEGRLLSFLSALAARPIDTQHLDKMFERSLMRLRRRRLKKELNQLNQKLTELERSHQDVGQVLQQIFEKRKSLEKIEI